MKVHYIKSAGSKGYLRIGIESDAQTALTVSESEYRDLGSPAVGDSLTDLQIEAIRRADMLYRARLKALRILSYGDNSERMLARKLYAAGIKRDIIESVVSEMVSLGYINSVRQLESLITDEVNLHLRGPLKIIPKLVSKGYSRSDIEWVIAELEAGGIIDFDSAKEKLVSTKLSPDADEEEIKKILYRNGYC